MTGDDQNSSERTGSTSEGNLELFFDLVFTFAMSQVTQLMLRDPSPRGFGRAPLAVLAVWWAWVGYAWLINAFDAAGVWHASAATLPALLHMPAIAALGLLAGIGCRRLAWELWQRPRIGPGVAGQAG